MKHFAIEWSDAAPEQVEAAQRRWIELGGNVTRLERAVDRAVKVIADFPDAGTTAEHIRLGLQQYPLRRTTHMIYYEVDRSACVVRILAFWHTSREQGPPL